MITPKLISSLTVLVAAGMLMLGADSPKPPATQPAGKPLTATVIAIQGLAQYRPAEDKPWEDAKVGQVVDIGGEFRTGPHSLVKFKIPPDQTITLDRLGTVKLMQAVQNDSKHVTAEMGMKYGRVRYDVEAGDQVEHQTTVRAPSATLSMSGSETFTFFDQRPGSASASGRGTYIVFIPYGSPKGIQFGRKGDNITQTVGDGVFGPADYRHHSRVDDPGSRGARSDIEFQILGNYDLYNGVDVNSTGITGFHGQAGAHTQVPTSQPAGGCCGGGSGN